MNSAYDSFKLRAEAVSAEVHRFARNAEALYFILKYLQDEGVTHEPQSYAVWAECPFLFGVDKQGITKRLPGLHFDVTREVAASARIGISQLDWAIANTGTLV